MRRGEGRGGSDTGDIPDEWDKLSDELARYALPILCAWMRKGTIKAKASEARVLGAGRILDGLRLTGDDATALACDVVVKALRYFRRRGLAEWDLEKGRSCKAYFLTCCLMMVPDAYRAWDRWRPRPTVDQIYLDDLDDLNEPASPERFERLVELQDAVIAATGHDPDLWAAFLMRLAGLSSSEISEHFPDNDSLKNRRRVSAEMAKLRDRLQEEGSAE